MTIRPLRRLTIVALVTLSLLAAITAPSRAAEARCQSVRQCHHDLAWAKHERRMLEKRLAIKLRPTVDYACRLGYAAFHVPVAHCKKVVGCESGGRADLNEYGGSNGARGIAQYQPRTWAGTTFARAGFSIYDPLAQILSMDAYASRYGFNTWGGWRASYGCHRYSGAES